MPDTFVFCCSEQHMDERRSENVMRYLQAVHQRQDLTEKLKNLRCRTLILVGDQSPFHHEALHISDTMNRRYNALIEVRFRYHISVMMRTHYRTRSCKMSCQSMTLIIPFTCYRLKDVAL